MNKLQQELGRVFRPYVSSHHKTQFPVYKFVSRKYLNAFFDTGSVRLGTLHDFRKIEAHGNWRGDASEGKSDIVQFAPSVDRIEEGSFLTRFFAPGPVNVRMTNNTFVEKRDFPNSFVFCTSSHFSENLFQQWHEKEGVDACYEIFDWDGYEREITTKLAGRADLYASSYVTYVAGDINGESEHRHIPPPFIKKNEYIWQSEYRGVWQHKSPSIDVEAACIEIPDARQYCRPFAVMEAGKVRRL